MPSCTCICPCTIIWQSRVSPRLPFLSKVLLLVWMKISKLFHHNISLFGVFSQLRFQSHAQYQWWQYRKTSSISHTKSQNLNVFVSLHGCLRSIHWSQVLSREWRFYCLLRCDLYMRGFAVVHMHLTDNHMTTVRWHILVSDDMFLWSYVLRLNDTDSSIYHGIKIDGLVQERRNSSALEMELCLSCTTSNLSKWSIFSKILWTHNSPLARESYVVFFGELKPSDTIWWHRYGLTLSNRSVNGLLPGWHFNQNDFFSGRQCMNYGTCSSQLWAERALSEKPKIWCKVSDWNKIPNHQSCRITKNHNKLTLNKLTCRDWINLAQQTE